MNSKLRFARGFYLLVLIATAVSLTEWLSITKTKAAVITVINTNDSGAGSLRQAILDSNFTLLTTDTILFAIPGAGVKTINLTATLPTITAPIIIDGWSQGGAGYTGPPLIELNGGNILLGSNGLTISAGDSTVRGVAINRFDANGILLQTNGGNTIQGNRIGTDPSGLVDLGNGGSGIRITSSNNTIGGITQTPGTGIGNVISGNDIRGVEIDGVGSGATQNTVAGNIIGLNASGTAVLANSNDGVLIVSAGNNTVGGDTNGARNVISGNALTGVNLIGGGSNVVAGNFIGTNLAGTAAFGNGTRGVTAGNSSNCRIGGSTTAARNVISGNSQHAVALDGVSNTLVQGNIIGLDATGSVDITDGGGSGVFIASDSGSTIVGGSTPTPGAPPGNVISGMGGFGVEINSTAQAGNTVTGNIIGLDSSGALDRGNTLEGVVILSSPNNKIGGTTPTARNVISGNGGHGVFVVNSSSTGTLVQNNFIGTQINPSLAAGNNASGISVFNAGNNTIGGGVGLGNTIAFNTINAVDIGEGSSGNTVFANSIYSNASLGIDLGPNGITANDPLDADSGPNRLQNFPVLTSAKSGNGTFVLGSLNSTPSATFTIEFFSNPSCDPSGHGEGQTFQGSLVVTTGADGNITFAHTLPNAVPVGQVMTCTATNNATRDTSEFSACQAVTAQSPSLVEFADATATAYDDGVLIEWHTGMEVDNLGFNLYRDEAGKQSRVNQQLIAGSALTVGKGVALLSGFSYQWWDAQPASNTAQYWLESVDLDGSSVWHGPFAASDSHGKEPPARTEHSRTLASLDQKDPPWVQVEPLAKPAQAKQGKFSTTANLMLASSSGVKIAVKKAGFYRLTQPELVASGLDAAADPRTLQLYVDGREQAMSVVGESDGRLDPTDTVEFYGQGIDSPFTDSHTYFLIAGKQQGRRIASVPSIGKPNPEGSFAFTIQRQDRTIYVSALLNGERENFFGAVVAAQPLNQALTVRHMDSSQNASLEVALQGVTGFPHGVTVQLNGSTLGYGSFTGQDHFVTTLVVPSTLLHEGPNTVTLSATGGSSDISLVDYLRLTYQREFKADNDSLRFNVEGQQQVTVRGFTQKSIRVFDVTNPDAVQELEGLIDQDQVGYSVSLEAQGGGLRSLLALTDATALKPDRVTPDSQSFLRSRANASEFVIITGRGLMQQAQLLKTHRQAQGLSVSVVDIEDVYDEFSFGQKTPYAIRDFLSYAAKHWRVPARYVLFFGDASYDVKNYFGVGDFDVVPTKLIDTQFMEAASDDWLADFNGDGLAELSLGRLPVRNETEAAQMIAKVIVYDQSNPSVEVLGVADRNEGYDFEHAIDLLHGLVPPDLKGIAIKRGQLGDTEAKAMLLEALNRGQKLVSYSGHGSVNVWRGNLLTDEDAGLLQNNERLSVFLMMNCLNGYFAEPRMDSLAESLLKAAGGAVTVWASSSMTYPDGQSQMNQMLYQQFFTNRMITTGDAVRVAKAATSDTDVRMTWILFGDPTTKLR